MAVIVYTQRICGYCMSAKRLLEKLGARYEEVPLDSNNALRQELIRRSGHRTVPLIWIGDHFVGGFDELYALQKQGSLEGMLKADGAL